MELLQYLNQNFKLILLGLSFILFVYGRIRFNSDKMKGYGLQVIALLLFFCIFA